MQELNDEIQDLENLSRSEILKLENLNKNRLTRDINEFNADRTKLLNKTVNKTINNYPDRVIRELYLNNRMKLDKETIINEIKLLKNEILELERKIGGLEKTSFEDRSKSKSLRFESKVGEDDEICFDFERKVHLPI